jgi:hypothetical protein
MRTYAVAVPTVIRSIAALPDGTLLEVPSGVTESKRIFGFDYCVPGNSRQMYFQTIHHHRRVGAYLSRIPTSTYQAFASEPILGDLFALTNPPGPASPSTWGVRNITRLPDYPPETVNRFLQRFDLAYVLLQPDGRQEIFRESVERVLAGHIERIEAVDGFVLLVLHRPPRE